jgi:hypothetical protein
VHELGLGTSFKCHSKHFPIGQLCQKCLNQKVKLESNLNLKWKRSKNAILIGKVLVHEIYIFGKRRKNVVCRKKPHQIWPYGLRDMAFWSSRFCENDLIISWQPYMGFESSWTFWKWENKIFNFHVGKKFIWSLYHDVSWGSRSFHFWQLKLQVHFLFLEISDFAPNSSMMRFNMIYEACTSMNELLQINSIHQITD